MAFKRDYSAREAFKWWCRALVVACVIGEAASFIPSEPVRAQQLPQAISSNVSCGASNTTGNFSCNLGAPPSGKTQFICGFFVTNIHGVTAGNWNGSVTGGASFATITLDGAVAASSEDRFVENFNPCLPLPNGGTGTISVASDANTVRVDIYLYGYNY